MSETTNIKTETSHEPSQRRGELDVCPICGSGVHPQAYFCARCSNYFCFVCRSRMAPSDPALQCINRDCEYFGKLVCTHCDPAKTVPEAPFVYKEPSDGYWPLWLLVSLLLSIFMVWKTTWVAGGLTFLGLYVGLGYLMQSAGCNIWGKERRVELPRSSIVHACARCSQPVKLVTLSRKS